jgi:hypothetical protein
MPNANSAQELARLLRWQREALRATEDINLYPHRVTAQLPTPTQLHLWEDPAQSDRWIRDAYPNGLLSHSQYLNILFAWRERYMQPEFKIKSLPDDTDKALDGLREASDRAYGELLEIVTKDVVGRYVPYDREDCIALLEYGHWNMGATKSKRSVWTKAAQRMIEDHNLDWDVKVASGVLQHYARVWYCTHQFTLPI